MNTSIPLASVLAVMALAASGILAAPDAPAPDRPGATPATMPAGQLQPGQAIVELAPPGQTRKGGFVMGEASAVMGAGNADPQPQERHDPSGQGPPDVAAIQEQVDLLRAQVRDRDYLIESLEGQFRRSQAFNRLEHGLPLTGETVFLLCETGKGHPFLCPTKWAVNEINSRVQPK